MAAAAFAHLDRSGEPWSGTLGSLGSVRVWADGTWQVEPADESARDTLAYGWAATLGHVRMGRRIVAASAMTPGADAPALLVSGSVQAQAEVCVLLAERGWQVIADTATPVDLNGATPVAYPRGGPWLVPRRLAIESDLIRAKHPRPGSTSHVIAVDPSAGPVLLAAHVAVSETAHVTDASSLARPVTGTRRLAPKYALLHDAPLAAIDDPQRVLAHDLMIGRLPLADLDWPGPPDRDRAIRDAAVDALLHWWTGCAP